MSSIVTPIPSSVDHVRPTTSAAEPVSGAASPTAKVMAYAAAVGPVLLAAASVAWVAGDDYAELRGILSFWAFAALFLTGLGLLAPLEAHAPRARAVLTTTLAIGAVAAGGFATEINMVEQFGVDRLIKEDTPSAMLTLGIPGPLFPISLLVIGLLAYRFRTMPRAQACLLVVGAALFPLSRIPQIPELAVVADLLLVAALVPVAVRAAVAARR